MAFSIAENHGGRIGYGSPKYLTTELFWSFPVDTSSGRALGCLAKYYAEAREPKPSDSDLASVLTRTAAMIISRH
jgi:hypothetical protein